MVKKLPFLSLLGSIYFLGISSLMAMQLDENPINHPPSQSQNIRRLLPSIPRQSSATFEEVENLFQENRIANAKACTEFEKKLTLDEQDAILSNLQICLSVRTVKNPHDKEIINIIKNILKDNRGDEMLTLLSKQFADLKGTYVTHNSGKKFFAYDTNENNGIFSGFPFARSHTKRILEINDVALVGQTLNPGDKVAASIILDKKNPKNDMIRTVAKALPVDTIAASFEKAEKDLQKNTIVSPQALKTITLRPLPTTPTHAPAVLKTLSNSIP